MRVTYSIPCVDGTQVPTLLHAADYYPYGSILRQHINGAQEKYLTTHHERDRETGLDYRGARYYDSDVARFLNLDPLAAEYASWSPYNYVMGDPVSLVDPDGRQVDDYQLKNDGRIVKIKDTNDPDRLFASNKDGSINRLNSIKVKDHTILPQLEKVKPGGTQGVWSMAKSQSGEDMYKLFNFAASNSSSEWSLSHEKTQSIDNYLIGSFFDAERSPSYKSMGDDINNMKSHVHSHPKTKTSELESMGMWETGPHGDWENSIERFNEYGKEMFSNLVYFPASKNLYKISAHYGPAIVNGRPGNLQYLRR